MGSINKNDTKLESIHWVKDLGAIIALNIKFFPLMLFKNTTDEAKSIIDFIRKKIPSRINFFFVHQKDTGQKKTKTFFFKSRLSPDPAERTLGGIK